MLANTASERRHDCRHIAEGLLKLLVSLPSRRQGGRSVISEIRLTRPVRPQVPQHLSDPDFEIERSQGRKVPEAPGEPSARHAQLDRRCRCRRPHPGPDRQRVRSRVGQPVRRGYRRDGGRRRLSRLLLIITLAIAMAAAGQVAATRDEEAGLPRPPARPARRPAALAGRRFATSAAALAAAGVAAGLFTWGGREEYRLLRDILGGGAGRTPAGTASRR